MRPFQREAEIAEAVGVEAILHRSVNTVDTTIRLVDRVAGHQRHTIGRFACCRRTGHAADHVLAECRTDLKRIRISLPRQTSAAASFRIENESRREVGDCTLQFDSVVIGLDRQSVCDIPHEACRQRIAFLFFQFRIASAGGEYGISISSACTGCGARGTSGREATERVER